LFPLSVFVADAINRQPAGWAGIVEIRRPVAHAVLRARSRARFVLSYYGDGVFDNAAHRDVYVLLSIVTPGVPERGHHFGGLLGRRLDVFVFESCNTGLLFLDKRGDLADRGLKVNG